MKCYNERKLLIEVLAFGGLCMKTFNTHRHQGLSMVELLAVLVILGIIAAIAVPTVNRLIANTQRRADLATVQTLNQATNIYRYVYLGEDYFSDAAYTSEQLMDVLVNDGFLNKTPLIQSKNASFLWLLNDGIWILQIDGVIIENVSVILQEEDITRGTGGNSSWIIHYHGNDTHITIPSSLGITTISVPGNYESSGNTAFMSKNLESVLLPMGLQTIGSMAFRDNQLTSIIIPQSVTSIQSAAFRENPITEITIGSNVTIMDRAFGSGYTGATQVTNAFQEAYALGGAGTYVLVNGAGIKQS